MGALRGAAEMKHFFRRLFRHPAPPLVYRVMRSVLQLAGIGCAGLLVSRFLLEGSGIEQTREVRLAGFLASTLLVILLAIAGLRIFRFVRERKRGVPGAMIRIRLASFFVLAGLVPLVLSIFFVATMFNTGMDVVYNPDIENSLDLSARFIRESRDSVYKEFSSYVKRYLAYRQGDFDERWKLGGMFEIERIGRYRVDSTDLPDALRRHMVGPADESSLFGEVDGDVTRLMYLSVTNGRAEFASMILHPVYGPGAERVVSSLAEYRRLRLVRKPLETALVLVAALVVGFVTLTSLLLAMRFARVVTEPVKELVEGTRRIARGELEYRVADVGLDEFAQLVDNFNNMSAELRQSRQRLFHAERIAAWQEVARRLAHEIKNPLTPIQLGAERILRQSRKGSENLGMIIEKVLPAMISEVRAIERLVDEFSSFARLPGKRTGVVDLGSFIEETVAPLKSAHEKILLTWFLEPGLVSAVFDKEQMRRALVNLVQNSLNAVAKTGRQGRIDLTIKSIAGSILFMVRDNGCGISAEDGNNVFAPYFSKTAGGTGLGLSIVEKIVVDHGGKIWFESSAQETVFFICLPFETVS